MASESKSRVFLPVRSPAIPYIRVFWGLTFYVGMMAMLYAHFVAWPVRLSVGQVIPYSIVSPMDASYIDSAALAKLMTGGKASIIDPRIADQAQAKLSTFFADMKQARLEGSAPTRQVELLASQYKGVPSELIALLFTLPDDELVDIEGFARDSLAGYMKAALSESDIVQILSATPDALAISMRERVPIYFLQENIVEAPDIPALQDYVNRLVTRRIVTGEVVLGAGGKVEQVTLDKLEAVEEGLIKQRQHKFYGVALLLAALMFIWLIHIKRYKRRIYENPAIWAQLALVSLAALSISLIIGRLPFRYIQYCVPLGIVVAVIILVTIYDPILASYIGIGLAVVTATALNYNSDLLIYMLLCAIYPVVLLSRKSEVRDLAAFGINLGLWSLLLTITIILFSVETFSWWKALYSVLTGIVAAVIALGVIPLLEMLTSQLTPGKLQALMNPELPLLKQMLEKAPGTYFHSLTMSSMSEEACNEISADGLLAKVGCMYHDIGKLKRPGFFNENISDPSKNPHRHLPPESSFNIVVQHVQDGLEIGRKHGLPSEVLAFIPEHHGTTTTKYFLEEARKRTAESGAGVDPMLFKYGGPDPKSKETGVVMLADVCEAKVRAVDRFTEEDARYLVDSVIQEKVKLGHLDSSKLTVGDLHKISSAFTRVLVNLHHQRLKYPEQWSEEAQQAPINPT